MTTTNVPLSMPFPSETTGGERTTTSTVRSNTKTPVLIRLEVVEIKDFIDKGRYYLFGNDLKLSGKGISSRNDIWQKLC